MTGMEPQTPRVGNSDAETPGCLVLIAKYN
jgi:hypothetical protein